MEEKIEETTIIQDAPTTPAAPPPVETAWTSMIPMALIFVVMYFLLIRPQNKRRKEQENLVSGVKKGEEVLTTSGIFGIITQINESDNTVMLKISNDTEIKVLKNTIADITSRVVKDKKPITKSENKMNKKVDSK